MTPTARQAICTWAGGCGYDLKPDSSLGQLVQENDECYVSSDVVEPRSHAPTNSETSIEVSYNETEGVLDSNIVVMVDDVTPSNRHCTINDVSASGSMDLIRLEARKTSSRATVEGNGDVSSIIHSPPRRRREGMVPFENSAEPSFAVSQIALIPSALFTERVGTGASLYENANPSRVSQSLSSQQMHRSRPNRTQENVPHSLLCGPEGLSSISLTQQAMEISAVRSLSCYQLSPRRMVSDAAQSIRLAIIGDIDGLKYLFGKGLASPLDVSHSREFTLVRVRLTAASQ